MQRPRTPSKLSESLHQRLNSYAIAASAAGVGMIVSVQPARAKIIYTKTHVSVYGYLVTLDLNHDHNVDFFFRSVTSTGSFHGESVAAATRYNGIRTDGGPLPLRAGAHIGASKHFFTGSTFMRMGGTNGNGFYSGLWEDGGKGVKNRYLGLRFLVNGKTHYGWARLNFPNPQGATLTGYAYETVPNKSIIAGKTHGKDVITVEPASLGHLARGASAIPAWRKGR
jgi:hypothetical protein